MSAWTHVAGVIRFDHLPRFTPTPDWEYILGRMENFDNWTPDALPSHILTGSEGSVNWSVSTERDIDHSMAAYVVTVWGDLRDMGDEDVEKIHTYFDTVLARAKKSLLSVRDAVYMYRTPTKVVTMNMSALIDEGVPWRLVSTVLLEI